jgi:hypothetical protein
MEKLALQDDLRELVNQNKALKSGIVQMFNLVQSNELESAL